MTAPPPGFVRTPNVVATALIELAVHPLPATHRDRYRDEFRAEVCCLPGRQQVRHAASILAGSLALSQALQEHDMAIDPAPRNPLTCRLGRHHYQTLSGDNDENRKDRHKECVHCGKIKEVDRYDPSDGRYLGGSTGLLP